MSVVREDQDELMSASLMGETNMADISKHTYADAVAPGPKEPIGGLVNDVKPVFILESDLFGSVKPKKDQFLTHIELYKAIDL